MNPITIPGFLTPYLTSPTALANAIEQGTFDAAQMASLGQMGDLQQLAGESGGLASAIRGMDDKAWQKIFGGQQELHVPKILAMFSPEDAARFFNQGVALQREGKRAEARSAYRRVFSADPEARYKDIHALACLNMGSLYLEENNFPDAAYVLLHAIILDPDRIDARSNYAVALLGLDRPMVAIRQWSLAWDDAEEGIQQDIARTLRQLVDKMFEAKKYETSLAALKVLLQHDSDNVDLAALQNQIEEAARENPERKGPKTFGPKDLKGLSKSVSYALRHAPWEFALELDAEGWANMDELVVALALNPIWRYVTSEVIETMVRQQPQKRYEIQGDRIRALYGHSIATRISKGPSQPPDILFHGTNERYLPSILANGLEPSGRQYVHLSLTRDQAMENARRKGKDPVILKIQALNAFKAGYEFYLGTEQVWLADFIPPEFFERDGDQ